MSYFFRAIAEHYVDFSGRERRKEYWLFVLFDIIFALTASVADRILGLGFIVSSLYSLVLFLPRNALWVRRLHDVGYSGWFLFWNWLLASVMGFVWLLSLGVYVTKTFDGLQSINPRGLYQFAVIITIVYGIFAVWFFVLMCKDSMPGMNQYGPNPKGNDGQTFGRSLVPDAAPPTLIRAAPMPIVVHAVQPTSGPRWACRKCTSGNPDESIFLRTLRIPEGQKSSRYSLHRVRNCFQGRGRFLRKMWESPLEMKF